MRPLGFSETSGTQYSIMKYHVPGKKPTTGTLLKIKYKKANEKCGSYYTKGQTRVK
jgi:hypothetical protein